MALVRFDRLLDTLTNPQLIWGVVWAGLAVMTVVLLVMMQTRWGQAQALRKCTILSLWVHLLLLVYTTTVEIVTQAPGSGPEAVVHITSIDASAFDALLDDQQHAPETWERFPISDDELPETAEPPRAETTEAADLQRSAQTDNQALTDIPSLPADDPGPQPEPSPDLPATEAAPPEAVAAAQPDSIEAPRPERQADPAQLAMPAEAQRQEMTGEPLSVPEPQMTESAPAVLGQFSPLPRLDDAPTTAEPAPMLSGELDMPATAASPIPPEQLSLDASGAPDTHAAAADAAAAAASGTAITSPQRDASSSAMESFLERMRPPAVSSAAPSASDVPLPPLLPHRTHDGAHDTPDLYRLRTAPNRSRVAEAQGGSQKTEEAVRAALAWLAANQEADGRWDASRHGGGRERQVLGHDRGGTGARADTGVTGLALLAFLGAGHTHQRGEYQRTVERGLQFLLRTQHTSGHLAGDAELYAFMYCHGMAALAISEAHAMTGDTQLQLPLRKAVAYSLAAQNRATGGWRYRPGDTGDMSQHGWQVMLLTSAQSSGMRIPKQHVDGALRFLTSVRTGQRGGLASYRPGEQVSHSMTAEALVCRQFLGLPFNDPAGQEAGDYLLEELPQPGGQSNLYYWYYATLATYQLQGPHWRQWNEAITHTLTSTQRTDGVYAGSWDQDDLWGGYAGRVYTTAMGALCLEVYYRYLPLYVEAANRMQTVR